MKFVRSPRKAKKKVIPYYCSVCGGDTFEAQDILWDDLVKQWELSDDERSYINRQQGYHCVSCESNLRSMTLAHAILKSVMFTGTLREYVATDPALKILEVNEAGHLNPVLSSLKNHTLASYPKVDITKLPYRDKSYDLIVHSDTLEHINDPVTALKETLRVLKPGGYTCFTIPMVVGRRSRNRQSLQESYHGSPGNDEYLVHTEFGDDAWTFLMEAGFRECRLVSIEYPSSVAFIARKE